MRHRCLSQLHQCQLDRHFQEMQKKRLESMNPTFGSHAFSAPHLNLRSSSLHPFSSMAPSISCSLFERVSIKNTVDRAAQITVLLLLLSFLTYRLVSLPGRGFPWLLAFVCELCFTLIWAATIVTRWKLIDYKTHPHRLLQREKELPPVDIFVTTADPVLEPPIITVNTVLSLLSVDYPVDKLACYVSDDGYSPLTLYSLVEASKFAQIWVPFCKKYCIQVRAPFRYLSTNLSLTNEHDSEFRLEEMKMKDEYELLCCKIEAASDSFEHDFPEDFSVFSDREIKNHPMLIKILLKNESALTGLPSLIYVSREKRPSHRHHYKAGAMNVLTRVSGVMTNAPFILNVDCDVFVNNPKVVLHAMCLFLGFDKEEDCVFVQCPQMFYNTVKDDPFGTQQTVLYETMVRGMSAMQGPFYGGSGCFSKRRIIYSLSSDTVELTSQELEENFGYSTEFIKSTTEVFSGLHKKRGDLQLFSSIDSANHVASCSYEQNTAWGSKVGWLYGTATEDVLTGMKIHSKGWKSVLLAPDPPAFLGCAPTVGRVLFTQHKRWTTGFMEILFSKNSPLILFLTSNLQFNQCLAYTMFLAWPLISIAELFYMALPSYCIIDDSHFLPKAQDHGLLIIVPLVIIYNCYNLYIYLRLGLTARSRWNNSRMRRIFHSSASLLGILSALVKILGLSETAFEITAKEQSDDGDGTDLGKFTFDESPLFIPGTTILLVHLTTLAVGTVRLGKSGGGCGSGEVLLSLLVVLCFTPFLKGLVRKGRYGVPVSTICKSSALALAFVHFCRRASMG